MVDTKVKETSQSSPSFLFLSYAGQFNYKISKVNETLAQLESGSS